MYTQEEKNFILRLARESIVAVFAHGRTYPAGEMEAVPDKLKEERACFVTIRIKGELRGCIGHTEPIQSLYADIVENAVAAAFNDPRFNPLTEEELKDIELEVFILSRPQELVFHSPEDLLNQLRPNIDGVIIRKGSNGATYLPSVWEELPDKTEFLSRLCAKAELADDEWRKPGLAVWTYQVESIK